MISAALTGFVFLADQMTKNMVFKKYPLHSTRPLVDSFLYLTPTQNRGSAFGFFQGSVLFFIVMSASALLLMLVAVRRFKMDMSAHIGFCVLMGGALGNLYDRVRHQYVLDFLDLKFWPVFNVADVAIVAGTLLLAAAVMRKSSRGVMS